MGWQMAEANRLPLILQRLKEQALCTLSSSSPRSMSCKRLPPLPREKLLGMGEEPPSPAAFQSFTEDSKADYDRPRTSEKGHTVPKGQVASLLQVPRDLGNMVTEISFVP